MTTRHRAASPDADDLAGPGQTDPPGGRSRKAPPEDPETPVAPSPHAKAKVGFYQVPADTARARAAYDWTRPRTRHRSFSDFIAAAIMVEVTRLEAEHHDGRPWPAAEPGELPTGRPLGT